ncbi:MAG: RluA family pseudouridine synthase [Candidatus Levybacteria bacterium]|nr:RluA family pseudouridine synthase [Candidatus Levybacteria bacterium]
MEDKLKIIFENESYAVLDKASGITVNRSDTTAEETTLQDLIEKENMINKSDVESDFINRSGIVHRLDKETSGVIIVAKNSKAFKIIQAQFKERQVEKTYIALVHGEIKPQTGEINVPVGRLPWNRKRFGILAGGREAATWYQTISNFKYPISNGTMTLVRLYPKTGRTHQIRVHLKYIGHPIFGDVLYGGRKTARSDRKILSRMFLHAQSLSFFDPRTGERVQFESQLPGELKKFVDSLEKIVN